MYATLHSTFYFFYFLAYFRYGTVPRLRVTPRGYKTNPVCFAQSFMVLSRPVAWEHETSPPRGPCQLLLDPALAPSATLPCVRGKVWLSNPGTHNLSYVLNDPPATTFGEKGGRWYVGPHWVWRDLVAQS